jgi:uncharacterized membrane protein (UPF0127 family)
VAASFLTPIIKSPGGPWRLFDARNGALVAAVVEAAFERKARNRGLLGRAGLADGHALVLAPCSSIHTFFMQFAIDVAFVDRDGYILKIKEKVRPWRLAVSPGAFAVVELAAGALARAAAERGDRLFLSRE